MQDDIFFRFGKLIYTTRWFIIITSLIIACACIPLLPKAISHFTSTGFTDPSSESAITDEFLKSHLGYRENQFIIMYQGNRSFTNNTAYYDEIKKSLSGLKKLPIKYEILYPEDNKDQISKDKKFAYATLMLKSNKILSEYRLEQLLSTIKEPPHLSMFIGGQPIFMDDTKKQTQRDLIKAEYIASPVAVITLLFVFGSVVAAFVPMLLDAICAILILSFLYLFGHFANLSVFTLNIALLLGLCLSLDYALFIISRFRDELHAGHNAVTALAITQATAGKAVFFSGLAVFISLSALFLFPINILFSVGMGGVTAVGVAVIVSIVVLPALLAVLNRRINWLRLRRKPRADGKRILWLRLVMKVVKFPKTAAIASLLLLLTLGYPFLSVKFGISDYHILLNDLESRKVFDIVNKEFNENQLTPIFLLVKAPNSTILTSEHIGNLYDFTQKLRRNSKIDKIQSIVNTTPRLTRSQYQTFYTTQKDHLPAEMNKLLDLTTGNYFTVITVFSKYPGDSAETKALISQLRKLTIGDNLTVEVTGSTANTMDVLHRIASIFPYALMWVIILSYIILLILLRSVILPVKAIIMNMLSLFASFGVLVFIIQDGYLAHLLNIEAQGMIDISLIIIIFCALFGFSMDYEVFLLTRIKESYERTGDNIASICYGIANSSKIITSAALIVIFICFAFLSANILLVKAFGLGIALAIFVDAFLIRTILVPAVMALIGDWNWYLPAWLDKILPKSFFAEETRRR